MFNILYMYIWHISMCLYVYFMYIFLLNIFFLLGAFNKNFWCYCTDIYVFFFCINIYFKYFMNFFFFFLYYLTKLCENYRIIITKVLNVKSYTNTYSYSQKYFAFLKCINFKEKMLREGIILKYFSYILINITRGTQK